MFHSEYGSVNVLSHSFGSVHRTAMWALPFIALTGCAQRDDGGSVGSLEPTADSSEENPTPNESVVSDESSKPNAPCSETALVLRLATSSNPIQIRCGDAPGRPAWTLALVFDNVSGKAQSNLVTSNGWGVRFQQSGVLVEEPKLSAVSGGPWSLALEEGVLETFESAAHEDAYPESVCSRCGDAVVLEARFASDEFDCIEVTAELGSLQCL